jgi:hypothetical protein
MAAPSSNPRLSHKASRKSAAAAAFSSRFGAIPLAQEDRAMTRLRKPGYRMLAELIALPSAVATMTLVLAVIVG